MSSFYEKLAEKIKSFDKVVDSLSIQHNMIPYRSIDVIEQEETKFWKVIDSIVLSNLETGESFSFNMDILNIPHRSVNGYKIKGVYRQLVDLYEMSKGWHFEDESKGNDLSKRVLKFNPDTSLNILQNFYSFVVKNDMIAIKKKNSVIPISVFMRALTGDSYSTILNKIGVSNRYLLSAFSTPEYTRAECVRQCSSLFQSTDNKRKNNSQSNVASILNFMHKFTASGAIIGNGSDRLVSMVSFRNIKKCFLRKAINLNDVTIPVGTKLTPELLLELDYSEVDEIVCGVQDSDKVYVFKKYEVYNFRGLHKGATDTIDDFKMAEKEGKLTYTLSNGEIISRLPAPFCNTVDIIYNMLNLYVNYLNGFDANSNIYDMSNQSVIGIEKDILNSISDRLTFINDKVEELNSDLSDSQFLSISLVLKMVKFDLNTLIDKYATVSGKEVHLSAIENSLSVLAQTGTIAKDVTHAQQDMVLVQPSQIGRLDPFDVPENKNIGITHNRTFLSKISEDSQLLAPFVRVHQGKVIPGIVYLSPEEERDQYIGEYDEDFSKSVTKARYNGVFMMVSPQKLNYIEASCFQHLSSAHALSPFAESMAGKRAQMSSANAKQVIAIVGAERPIINTGAESLVCLTNDFSVPYFTANDLVKEYALAHDIDFSLLEDVTLTYDSFSTDGTDRIHSFSFLFDGNLHKISKKLPLYQKTIQGTVYGFSLNKELGLEFKGNDIVLHSYTFDPKCYQRDDLLKEGHLKFDNSVYDKGLALGINLHIGYMTYGSTTIEDAITLSDRLVTDDGLSSVSVYQEEYEIKPMDIKRESFGFLDDSVIPEGFGYDGFPIVGTYLSPGSVVIYKYIRRFNTDGLPDEESMGYTTNIELPPTVGGEVVSVIKKGTSTVVVTIVSLSKIEIGDKMAGRYGNKGVVARIVPHYLMPFDPSTGKPLDIILNPLGIPSRVNVSQVLEVTLAACNRKQGTISVVTPFQHNQLQKIKEKAQQCGIKPIHLMNPLTNTYTNYAVHVGEIYMYKLMHRVSGKMHSIGITNEVDAVFKQPVGTGKSKAKGQAFGEMESWCLQSSKSFTLLEELQTILADDISSRNKARSQIIDIPKAVDMDASEFTNDNRKHIMVFFKSAGIKVVQDAYDPSMLSFEPMTDYDIQLLNPNHSVNVRDSSSSLRNPNIFGESFYNSEDKWSWMPLYGEIVNPFWIERGNILKVIVIASEKRDGYGFSVIRPIDVERILSGVYFLEEKVIKGKKSWVLHQGNKEGSITGMNALVTLFKNYDLTVSLDYYTKLKNKKNNDSKISQIIASIQDIRLKGGLSSYVISCFPVMPIRYRPLPMIASAKQDFDYFYEAIARCVTSYSLSRSNEDLVKVYEYIKAFLGLLSEERKNVLLSNNTKYADLKTYFTVKQSSGRIRGMMAKKRVHRSGRSVLIPFSNKLYSPKYIGVPYLMAIDLYKDELVSLLQKTWTEPFIGNMTKKEKSEIAYTILKNSVIDNEQVVRQYSRSLAPNQSRTIRKMIQGFVEKQILIFGRQPSLFKFNIRAFYVKLVDGKALQLNPLVCKGFNADYDGDTGYVIAPITQKACQEAWDTLSVVASLVDPGNGEIILEPSQDILLGCYYATSLQDNVLNPIDISPIYYSNITLLKNDLDLGFIQPYTWVIYEVEEKRYISTAGRIVFNSLIPNGFTSETYEDKYGLGIKEGFYNLRYDYIISGRVSNELYYTSIKGLFRQIYDEYGMSMKGRDNVIEYYQAICEFGFKWSERSGISFCLEDLHESSVVNNFLVAAQKVSDEIDRKFSMGLITERNRRNAVMSVYSEIRTKNFQKKFMQEFERTNNIFMMFDSKARGSEDQIMQTCGLLGVLQKTKTDSLDTPITSNYSVGLGSFDLFQTSYSARLGLLSTIQETSKPGELTRTLVYSFSGLYVSEDKCYSDCSFRIRYKRVSDFLFLDGKKITFQDMLGAKVVDDFVLPYIKYISDDMVITENVLDELKYSGLPWFDTDRGRVYFDVDFPEYLSKLLLYRTLNTRTYSYLIDRKYISYDTIAQIVEGRPRTLDVMLLCNCFSEDGICSDSYGLYYDSEERAKIGDFPGVESAQALGQPTSQLTISLFHTVGKVGEAVDDGVAIMMSAIQSGKVHVNKIGLFSPIDGYVKIEHNMLSICSPDGTLVSHPLNDIEGELFVKNGSYVTIGQRISEGNLHPLESFVFHKIKIKPDREYTDFSINSRKAVINPSKELITQIRYELAKFYHDTYYENSIHLLGRHFEIPAFLQTSHGVCLYSENPDYIEGRFYSVGELVNAQGIDFALTIQNAVDVITRNSGVIAAACYQNAYAVIGATTLKGDYFRERGPLSAILTGSSIVSKGLYITDLSAESKSSVLQKVKHFSPTSYVKEIEVPIVFNDNVKLEVDEQIDEDTESDIPLLDDLLSELKKSDIEGPDYMSRF